MAQPQLTVEWARLTVDWPQLQVEWPLVRPMGHFLKASAIIFAACVAAMSGAPTQTGTMDGIDALSTPGTNQAIFVFSQHSAAADLGSSAVLQWHYSLFDTGMQRQFGFSSSSPGI